MATVRAQLLPNTVPTLYNNYYNACYTVQIMETTNTVNTVQHVSTTLEDLAVQQRNTPLFTLYNNYYNTVRVRMLGLTLGSVATANSDGVTFCGEQC